MENIKIYNYKQIKETFKEMRVSKETFENLEYKYIPIIFINIFKKENYETI